MTNKTVFISLVNWSQWEDTLNVVNQLLNFNFEDLEITIGVVDNDSPNDSFEKLSEKMPEEVLLTKAKSNEGYAAGHTINLDHTKAQNATYFWVLNSDVELYESTLPELLDVSNKLNGKALVGSVTLSGPNTIDFGGSVWKPNDNQFHYNDWKDQELSALHKQHPDYYRVQTLEGSSLMIPINIIEEHGFMKTDFFMYGEETDYCLRLDKRGISSYVATRSVMLHNNEGSLKYTTDSEIFKAYYRRRNYLRIQREHFGMSFVESLRQKDGIINNLKTLIKGLVGRQNINYFYSLGTFHAALGKKGKKI